MALSTVSQVKSFLNIQDSSKDTWLTLLEPAAESVIKQYLGRDLESNSYTEYYDGNNQPLLPLRQRPITAVTGVWCDFGGYYGDGPGTGGYAPFANPSCAFTEGIDYAVMWDMQDPVLGKISRSGILVRIATVWTELGFEYQPGYMLAFTGPAYGSYKVQYTAGYTIIPMDIQQAVACVVAGMMRDLPLGGPVAEERIGEYSYKLEKANRFEERYPELGIARQLLSRYKEFAI